MTKPSGARRTEREPLSLRQLLICKSKRIYKWFRHIKRFVFLVIARCGSRLCEIESSPGKCSGTPMGRPAKRADDTCFYWNADVSLIFCFLPPGESGLGKSTLINSLFLTDLYSSEYPGPSHRIKKTVQVRSCGEELQQGLHHLHQQSDKFKRACLGSFWCCG